MSKQTDLNKSPEVLFVRVLQFVGRRAVFSRVSDELKYRLAAMAISLAEIDYDEQDFGSFEIEATFDRGLNPISCVCRRKGEYDVH